MDAIGQLDKAPEFIRDAELGLVRWANGAPQGSLEHIDERMVLLRNLLAEGRIREFVRACYLTFISLSRFDDREAVAIIRREGNCLQQLARTIRCLEYYCRELPWPLQTPWSSRFAEIWRRYVRNSAIGVPESSVDVDRELVLKTIAQFRGWQDQIIDDVLQALTPGMTARQFVSAELLEDYKTKKRTWEIDAISAAHLICAENRPSLISAFCVHNPNSEVREFSEEASRTLAKYLKPFLSPETLLEAVERSREISPFEEVPKRRRSR